MYLSQNLSVNEAIKSNTATRLGINNDPDTWEVKNLIEIAENVFQKVRDHFGVPIGVSSGFRSKELNAKIGGSTNSQHCKGQALDLDADMFEGVTNAEIFEYISENLSFDQLIWEFGDADEPNWVHVSYVNKKENRGRSLRAVKEDGVTTYIVI